MRTLVNIITEETLLQAYLFIKEKYKKGDMLMFISPRDEAQHILALTKHLKTTPGQIIPVVLLHDGDEYTYERICRRIREFVQPKMQYLVNLSGGSNYMALAVQQAFERQQSKFFYTDTDENIIVESVFDDSIFDNDDYVLPVKYRLSLKEYFELHGLSHDLSKRIHQPIQSQQQAKVMFEMFSQNRLRGRDYDVLEVLREEYRNLKGPHLLDDMAATSQPKCTPLPGIKDFIDYLRFTPSTAGQLTRDEIEYLTGGWFEEYVYYLVKQQLNPFYIAIGVHVYDPKAGGHNNELDVVFLRANMLYVIECKTGVDSKRMFNDIVYKAAALKETLLGVDCHSYIFSLKNDGDGALKKVASCMDLQFCDRACLTNSGAVDAFFDKIRNDSHV